MTSWGGGPVTTSSTRCQTPGLGRSISSSASTTTAGFWGSGTFSPVHSRNFPHVPQKVSVSWLCRPQLPHAIIGSASWRSWLRHLDLMVEGEHEAVRLDVDTVVLRPALAGHPLQQRVHVAGAHRPAERPPRAGRPAAR